MRITTIGKPKITGSDGKIRPVPGQQPWALLGRLLMAGRPVSRRTVAAELFCDAEDPLGALRWALASLRRALGPDTLNGDPVDLNLPEAVEVDLWTLERTGAKDIEPAEFLEGIEPAASSEFSTWLLVAREQVATRLHHSYRRQAVEALSLGNATMAIRYSEHAIRLRPLDESGHVLLIRALSRSGNMGAALAHLEATEKEFVAQLGEAPSPALRAAARKDVADPPIGISLSAIVESLLRSGKAAIAAGAVEAGLENLRQAAAKSEKTGSASLTARSFHELGAALVHATRGFDDEGAVTLHQAARFAADAGEEGIAALAYRELGYIEALAGRRPSSQTYLEKARLHAPEDDNTLASIDAVSGFNLVDWGDRETGLAHFEIALDRARSCGNKRREIWALGIGGWGQLRAGNPETAKEWLDLCERLCRETAWVAFQPWPQALLVEADLALGQKGNTAQAALEEALALSRQLSDPCWEAASSRSLALLHANRGDFSQAERWLNHARATCCSVTDFYAGLLVEIFADQMRLQQETGNDDGARSLARELLSLAARTHADAHLDMALAVVNSRN